LLDERSIPIRSDADVVIARQYGRTLAQQLGFSSGEATLLATAISEVARNIVLYAASGEITVCRVTNGTRQGISVTANDRGPGIPDVGLAMQDGYSTSRSLGLGLPGARRLVDEFSISSQVGRGTSVTMKKWAS
jgi:serine/threonine-protein kinase RsbT